MLRCPECESERVVKNGHIHNGKQNHLCRECHRQFVLEPAKGVIPQHTTDLIKRLLLERLSLRAIARVSGVSLSYLQAFVNELYRKQPHLIPPLDDSDTSSSADTQPPAPPASDDSPAPTSSASGEANAPEVPAGKRLTLECDELWSFVTSKLRKVWVWLALDADTRRIVAVHFGERDRAAAQRLWDKLPDAYKTGATCYTDFWDAYQTVIPPGQHQAVGKESGKTNHVERFNNTLRQRCARLVRKTLSFSKKMTNHIGAILYFIHHYNLSLL